MPDRSHPLQRLPRYPCRLIRWAPARVVISWLDGPSRDEVAARLANQPSSGLRIELVHEKFDELVDEVVDAAANAVGDPQQLTVHPVLERVRAVDHGSDTYVELLDLVAAMWPELKQRPGGDCYKVLRAVAQLDDQDAVDAVLDDVDDRVLGSPYLAVRRIDDHAMLTASFVLLALVSRVLMPLALQRTRRQMRVQKPAPQEG